MCNRISLFYTKIVFYCTWYIRFRQKPSERVILTFLSVKNAIECVYQLYNRNSIAQNAT